VIREAAIYGRNTTLILYIFGSHAGGRNNVQKLLHGQRECATVEIEYTARTTDGIEKLGGGHQEPNPDEPAALRERRPRLFLAVSHRGNGVKCADKTDTITRISLRSSSHTRSPAVTPARAFHGTCFCFISLYAYYLVPISISSFYLILKNLS